MPACSPASNAGLDRAADDGARVVVLTGSGSAFCAGADLAAVGAGLDDLAAIERLLEDAGKLTLRIEAHPSPVIAAVNGAPSPDVSSSSSRATWWWPPSTRTSR